MNALLGLVNLRHIKAEKEAWLYSKVTVSSCGTTSVII